MDEKKFLTLNKQANKWWKSLSDEARISICMNYTEAFSDKALNENGCYIKCAECDSSIHNVLALRLNDEYFCSRKCITESQQSRKRIKNTNL